MRKSDDPTFDEAILRYQEFLESQGWFGAIVWIRPADAALIGSELFLWLPEPSTGRERARADYSRACDRELGVESGLLCQAGAISFCFVYGPRNEDESQRHLMPDGLKLSFPIPVPTARIVVEPREWRRIKIQSRPWASRKASLFHQEP
jgi:hypothetical protein